MMNSKFTPNDEWYTTRKIWESVTHFIPKDKIIWECFHSDNSKSAAHLRSLGHEVVWEDCDFFTNDYGDILVSNMPFSKKKEVLTRLRTPSTSPRWDRLPFSTDLLVSLQWIK